MKLFLKNKKPTGFTVIEIAVACAVFPLVVISTYAVFRAISTDYTRARQYNDIYAILSACPEIDRALDYDIVTGANNCYPNNTFYGENNGVAIYNYTPSLTVTQTSSLPNTDPLQAVPDSKVIDIQVSRINSSAPAMELRMLITRNGIGQL